MGVRVTSTRAAALVAAMVTAVAMVGWCAEPARAAAPHQTIEAEKLLPAVTATAPARAQPDCCGVSWSNRQQVWFQATRPGDFMEVLLPVGAGEQYDLSAAMTQAPDYGYVRLSVDGVAVGQVFDGYHAGGMVLTGPVQFGSVALAAGRHRLRLTVTDHNPASTGYFAGIDTVTLTPRAATPGPVSNIGYDERVGETPTAGPRSTLYDTGPDWYYNDHTIIWDAVGRKWHLFGISHAEPPDGGSPTRTDPTATSAPVRPWPKPPHSSPTAAADPAARPWPEPSAVSPPWPSAGCAPLSPASTAATEPPSRKPPSAGDRQCRVGVVGAGSADVSYPRRSVPGVTTTEDRLYFFSGSADLPPGHGVHEQVVDPARYTALAGVRHWRRKPPQNRRGFEKAARKDLATKDRGNVQPMCPSLGGRPPPAGRAVVGPFIR
jgi:hypothetical protein